MGGWDQMRARIRGDDEEPMLYVFSTCREFIRTVPALQHDLGRPEDIDTAAEDHICDEARYAEPFCKALISQLQFSMNAPKASAEGGTSGLSVRIS
jgi:hypothetical protein